MQTTLPFLSDQSSGDTYESILFAMSEKRLSVTLNNRLKKSWNIKKTGKQFTISIPGQLSESPREVKEAIIEWAQIMISTNLSRKKLSIPQKRRVSSLEKVVWDDLHGEESHSRNVTIHSPVERFRNSFGAKFDLKDRFNRINSHYFNSELNSLLRWGQHGSKTSYHTIINDEHKNPHHLITIAGLYNHPSVPTYALDGVLYHEMLHIECPPIEGAQRRNVHHREFRIREQEYLHYEKWQKWLRRDAIKLLRRIKRG